MQTLLVGHWCECYWFEINTNTIGWTSDYWLNINTNIIGWTLIQILLVGH
jgi:hypothetical protein